MIEEVVVVVVVVVAEAAVALNKGELSGNSWLDRLRKLLLQKALLKWKKSRFILISTQIMLTFRPIAYVVYVQYDHEPGYY